MSRDITGTKPGAGTIRNRDYKVLVWEWALLSRDLIGSTGTTEDCTHTKKVVSVRVR